MSEAQAIPPAAFAIRNGFQSIRLAPAKAARTPKKGKKASEEDDLGAVPEEEILPDLDLGCGQADIATVAQQQPVPEHPAQPISDVVAENSTDRSSGDMSDDIQTTVLRRHSREDEGRFTRQRRPMLSRATMIPTARYP